jgi:glutamate synthase (NADPH) small chain
MGNPKGFLQIRRSKGDHRPIEERLTDYQELDLPLTGEPLREQAARCMDCGIPFCHKGCPLGNLIPEWNDWVYTGRMSDAERSLLATNNFPEITGRVCPAPCEAACVLGIDNNAVSIKDIERAIADSILGRDLEPQIAPKRSGKRVAVIGSGPAGLAAAQQLARKGHRVTVYEKADRVGGLLRYGIPDFKLDKSIVDRRVDQLRKEGVRFQTSVTVGESITGRELLAEHEIVVLALGAELPRALNIPGADLHGVHMAMAFLTQQNRAVAGDAAGAMPISARNKRVIILGGGDTGSDCLGTSLRQGATSVAQYELFPAPPEHRAKANPWPEWPLIMRTSSSQEEGGERAFGVLTKEVLGEEGRVRALRVVDVRVDNGQIREVPNSSREVPCDLLLLAMGFTGVPASPLYEQLGLTLTDRNVLARTSEDGETTNPRVFVAGDAARGASLVVWAIAEGRRVAEAVHRRLVEPSPAGATKTEQIPALLSEFPSVLARGARVGVHRRCPISS